MSTSSIKMPYDSKSETALMTRMWSDEIKWNPLNFVMFSFPWGKEGTPLAKFKGPRSWQVEELTRLSEHIARQRAIEKMGIDEILEMYRSATVSGRGPGKSTLVAWLVLWMMSCHLGSTTIVTANTEAQLKTKTWAELGKWHTLAINAHWFERLSLSLRPNPWFENLLKTQLKLDTAYYYAEALLWNEDNPDAFAGTHNFNGTLLIFDEASGIPQAIWDVSEGFFTEKVVPRFWFVFSNPRRNTGPFFECFHKHREFWPNRRHIDSRTIEGIDRKVLDDIVKKNGEDSDAARVEVKGEFPLQGEEQFISRETVDSAMVRELEVDDFAPLIMGVDPARKGRDSTAIVFRRGRDARSIPYRTYDKKDNMFIANECARLIDQFNPDGVFIDAGNGTGIIDRLRELNYKVTEVWFGSSSDQPQWADKRTEMWATMKEWLEGGCIAKDDDLYDDLVGPEKQYRNGSDVVKLESKDDMESRGLASPDLADALACTFFQRVARKDSFTGRNSVHRRARIAPGSDYDPLGG